MDFYDKARDYRDRAHKLFDDWRAKPAKTWKAKSEEGAIDHGKNSFVTDGIACPEVWFSQDVRPLFLLKEAYTKEGSDEGPWDLCSHITREEACIGARDSTWRRITQWARGITRTTSSHIAPFAEGGATSSDEPGEGGLLFDTEHLRKAAVVNVKKSGGRSRSSSAELMAYAEHDASEIAEQIKMIEPTVIVCGNTGNYLAKALDENLKKPRNEELFYFLNLEGRDVIVIDYWHPANQFPDIMNYYGLIGIYQQALKRLEELRKDEPKASTIAVDGL